MRRKAATTGRGDRQIESAPPARLVDVHQIFNGARIATRAEVRINGVVHLMTTLPPTRSKAPQLLGTVFGLQPAPAGHSVMPISAEA